MRRLPIVLILLLGILPVSGANKAGSSASSHGLLLVANANDEIGRQGEGYVTFIDPAAGEAVAKGPEGEITAHELVVSPDGRFVFAPIYGNSGVGTPGTDGQTIAVIDLNTRKVVSDIDFGHGVRPHFGVFGPKDGLLYVTTELTSR